MKVKTWHRIYYPQKDLQLEASLTGGQSFRWKQVITKGESEYIGVMANCVWIIKQRQDELLYTIVGELPYPECKFSFVRMKQKLPKKTNKTSHLLYSDDYYEFLLKMYLRLDFDLEDHYKRWTDAHDHFRKEARRFYGIRVLNQDPVENIFSFICSQNNNILRISSLVEKLCRNYGTKICDYNGESFFSFPDIHFLADPSIESELRKNSFGYRAKFINKSAEQIMEMGGLEWLHKLQNFDYKETRDDLLKLTGIGPKVADCICLMSLNHLEAIPVDTHVYQLALEHYLPTLKRTKSITVNVYAQIADHLREVYGPFAGWAQTVLFCADLSKFQKKQLKKAVRSKP